MKTRSYCPVCGCPSTKLHWLIPFATLPEPITINGARTSDFPCLTGEKAAAFARCDQCKSVFLSDVPENQAHTDRHYVEKMADEKAWAGYFRRYDWFKEWIPRDATTIVDAACGVGQYLKVVREREDFPVTRFVALEANPVYIAAMRESCPWMEVHQTDLANFDPASIEVAADFLVFSEAFEHMFDAGQVVRSLAGLLRPGGRMFLSAQSLEHALPVRPAETIYINQRGLAAVATLAGLDILAVDSQAGRYWVVFERAK